MHISPGFYRKIERLDEPFRDAFLSLAEEVERSRADTVSRDDFRELRDIVKELAEAQKRTEVRMEELAEAQERTEHALQLLSTEHRKTREQVGGLATTVGYRLEDEAFKALLNLLKKEHGLEVEGRLKRQFVEDSQGKMVEVNIFGSAIRNGDKVIILGEAKSQLSRKGVDEFVRKEIKRFSEIFKEIFPVMVTYMISAQDVEEYARKKGIAVYYSYDF